MTAYKIIANPRAWWPVTFNGVTEDGEVVSNQISLRFRILDEDANARTSRQIDKILAPLGEGDDKAAPSLLAADVVMLLAEDWKGVLEDDGTEAGRSLPFDRDNVATLLKVPNVFPAIISAYRACRAGEPEVRRGN